MEKERAVWKNILADDLFPKNSRVVSKENEFSFRTPVTGPAKKMLEVPIKEKGIAKRDEIRNRILMGKSRFISYKDEGLSVVDKSKEKKELVNKSLEEVQNNNNSKGDVAEVISFSNMNDNFS